MQTCAQVLLSLGNLAARGQYMNASNTFRELFAYGAVPVVNENDTVAVEELRIGDNDTLSAQVPLPGHLCRHDRGRSRVYLLLYHPAAGPTWPPGGCRKVFIQSLTGALSWAYCK